LTRGLDVVIPAFLVAVFLPAFFVLPMLGLQKLTMAMRWRDDVRESVKQLVCRYDATLVLWQELTVVAKVVPPSNTFVMERKCPGVT
jgi:hypothetical protein